METNIYKNFKSKLIFGKYLIKYLISKSTFSEVYFGTNILNGKNYALKIGTNQEDNYILKKESYVLLNLKGPGIPSVISYGISGKYNILVENLLGKSIKDIWLEKNKKFNLKDTCIFAIQAISLLEYVHSKNYLHRDIKPANFLIGNPDNSQIYLIDFGNASKFRSSRTGKHIKNIKCSSVFGSLLFLSKNAYKGNVQTRKDDLESLGLVIIYLYMGSLPWSEIKGTNIYQSWDKIVAIRNIVSNEYICMGMPQEMETYMNYINNLKYDERPDYEYLIQLFLNILKKIGGSNEQLFSWADKKKIQSSKKSSSKSKSKSKNKIAKIICQNLLKNNSKKANVTPNLKMLTLNNHEKNMSLNYNYYNINELLEAKEKILTKNNKAKYKKVIINNKDNKIKKLRNNSNINLAENHMANKLIINPKKINYERITNLTDDGRKKTKKFINDDNYINIYEGLVNKDITRKNFKSNKNHTKTHGNSTNTNSDTKNYIDIKNLNIINNSYISNTYRYKTIRKNDEYNKKLDVIEKNNINNIKTTPSSNYINHKSYKPISNILFSSHINSRENNNILYNNKNNQNVGNSFTFNSPMKTFVERQNLNPHSIQYFRNGNIGYIHKSILYESKDLKNNGLTKFIFSNPHNNIYNY